MSEEKTEITVLEGLEAIERRPEMYVGPLGRAEILTELVKGALCIPLFRAASGEVTLIEIQETDASTTVRDDGQGLSVQPDEHGRVMPTHLMTVLEACAREKPASHRDLCDAAPLAVVNGVSASAVIETSGESGTWRQEFRDGWATGPLFQSGPPGRGLALTFTVDRDLLRLASNARPDLDAVVAWARARVPCAKVRVTR